MYSLSSLCLKYFCLQRRAPCKFVFMSIRPFSPLLNHDENYRRLNFTHTVRPIAKMVHIQQDFGRKLEIPISYASMGIPPGILSKCTVTYSEGGRVDFLVFFAYVLNGRSRYCQSMRILLFSLWDRDRKFHINCLTRTLTRQFSNTPGRVTQN